MTHPLPRFRRGTRLALAAIVAVCALPAFAGPPALERAVIGAVPREASLVVVVNDASGQIDRSAGAVGVRMLAEADLLTEPVKEAWADLADSLGWSSREAFDELLGHRFAFFGDYQDRDGLRWAMVTQVSEKARTRMIRKLDLTPRTIVGERVIHAGERGAFLVALGQRKDGWCSLLLAELESKDMFQAALPMLTGEGGDATLGAGEAFKRTPINLESDAIVIINDADALTTVTLSARRDGYDGDIAVAPEDAREIDSNAAWSTTMLDRLDENALAVVLGVIGADAQRSWLLRLADEALGGFTELIAARFGGRVAIVLETEAGAVPGESTLGVSAALETNDVFGASFELDAAMSEIVPKVEALPGAAAPRKAPNYKGEHYEAVRVEPLQGPVAAGVARGVGPEPAATWVARHWGEPRRGSDPPDYVVARTGWWCVGVAAGGVSSRVQPWPVQRLCAELGAEQAEERPTHRVLAVFRPRAFVRWLEDRGELDAPFALGAVAWIEEIQWRLKPAQRGLLTGDVRIKLAVDQLR